MKRSSSSGSWFEALREWSHSRNPLKQFDVIMATPPQTPGIGLLGQRCMVGLDGTSHLFTILDQAPTFLDPRRGRLWILPSLCEPHGSMAAIGGAVFSSFSRPRNSTIFVSLRSMSQWTQDSSLISFICGPPGVLSSMRLRTTVGSSAIFYSCWRTPGLMKSLISNADDLGADETRNAGIFEGIQQHRDKCEYPSEWTGLSDALEQDSLRVL